MGEGPMVTRANTNSLSQAPTKAPTKPLMAPSCHRSPESAHPDGRAGANRRRSGPGRLADRLPPRRGQRRCLGRSGCRAAHFCLSRWGQAPVYVVADRVAAIDPRDHKQNKAAEIWTASYIRHIRSQRPKRRTHPPKTRTHAFQHHGGLKEASLVRSAGFEPATS